jgi:prefoldin subunit 5
MTPPEAPSPETDGVAERLRAELEQAHVAIEDMSERLAELARANEELTARLKEEARLRALTELQLRDLRERPSACNNAGLAEGAALRQELSVALEELQVMQEELQAAHDALSGAQRR